MTVAARVQARYYARMKWVGALAMLAAVTPLASTSIDLDVTAADIDRVLVIARSRQADRDRFHAPYLITLNGPVVQSIEVVTELRRVVLLAEARLSVGDHGFSYSLTRAQQALAPWKHRVAVIVRMRFHPQNNYVGLPPIDLVLDGPNGLPIEVVKDPVLAFPTSGSAERLPVLGATVEGVFNATTVGQMVREVVVSVDGKVVARTKIDLATLD
jgi:hypothetical protein